MDDRVPERRDSHASSSHEASLEPIFKRREDLGKHSVYTHFPKDRNCEICERTKITRAPCRRRKGEAVPRADNFGDLITADHKVLSDNCESRNNHRYAVVVQDLATQWIQAYLCKTKLHKKHKGACKSSWSQIGSLKSFTLTIPWKLARPVKIFPGILLRQHCTDRKRKGHLRYCCNQVWMKNGRRFPWNVSAIFETSQIYCLMGNSIRETFWRTIQRTNHSIWCNGRISPYFCHRFVKISCLMG